MASNTIFLVFYDKPTLSGRIGIVGTSHDTENEAWESHQELTREGRSAYVVKAQRLFRKRSGDQSGPSCRACGAPIKFVKTPAEKWLPVDPDQISSDDLELGEKYVSLAGEVVTQQKGAPSSTGYIPHWATCPNAEQFRKR